MSFETKATIASFGGKLLKLTHPAKTTNCTMGLNLYLPPAATTGGKKVPVLFYLSGLTCTGDNCAEKGFFQHGASEKGIAVVYPDTSPRMSFTPVIRLAKHPHPSVFRGTVAERKNLSGLNIPGEDDSYDFGSAAGFYIDATQEPWTKGYNMYSYIKDELPQTLFSAFPDQLDGNRVSITGHSMGGHGALTLFLKNPGKYKSCSAFAPIANPSACPWGQKAFSGYFGADNKSKWAEHDATELLKSYKGPLELLIDVGTGDNFYKQGQLLPENFIQVAKEKGLDGGIKLRMQPDYDHSYYFMASFADEHVAWAAKALGA
ncbi:Alpha/Beta hydrolase protein [Lineolata rhizophorae]|uniref:S-formylglutathione hydrolase n=1 Tax=Lineolata rhizophorae TaxID=578093 RepID=A0A6A6PBP9_9PEZI|nr:Alpha/Beta hydrolase protein [Lineolata rhizophorae]